MTLIERTDAARAAVERLEHAEGRASESRVIREALLAVIACFDVPPQPRGAVDRAKEAENDADVASMQAAFWRARALELGADEGEWQAFATRGGQ